MAVSKIPADFLLDQAIVALGSADASALCRLRECAFTVSVPLCQNRYDQNRDVFAGLLEATGRNLRLLRRANERYHAGIYMCDPR